MPSGLGRGLGSLIPQKVNKPTQSTSKNTPKIDKDGLLMVDINLIKANQQQPREYFEEGALEELAGSIKQHGILQPLVVSKNGSKYELVAGERRLRAAKIIGLKQVPVVLKKTKDEQEKLILALTENIQRKDLNPIEEAMGYQELLNKYEINQSDLARVLNKPRTTIVNTLRLLKLPEKVRQAISEGKIVKEHAKIIAGMSTEKQQLALLQKIIDNKLTKRATVIASREFGGTKKSGYSKYKEDTEREQRLMNKFSCEARIVRSNRDKQRVILRFNGADGLEEFFRKINVPY